MLSFGSPSVCELQFCISARQCDVNSWFAAFTAEYSPFLGIEKGAVLQEARVFNDPQLDPRRCSQVRALSYGIICDSFPLTFLTRTQLFCN